MQIIDRLTLKHMRAYRPSWDWEGMRGSLACLKWSFRDLLNLEHALQYTERRAIAVQAGGNLGLFPKRLAECFQTVHTFEPDQNLYWSMRYNAGAANVIMHQCALGADREPVALSHARRDGTGRAEHEGLTHVSGPGSIKKVLIDDLNLQACDLIYLDIEGMELQALEGAKDTLLRYRPTIGIEINRNCRHYGADEQTVFHQVQQRYGYRHVHTINSDAIFTPIEGTKKP